MNRLLVFSALALCVIFTTAYARIPEPGKLQPHCESPQGKAISPNRTPPAYNFTRTPIPLMTSYYDYMIGSYNSLPLQVIPQSAGGGYFMTYHAQRAVTGLRRVFYSYLDANCNVFNNVETSQYTVREGYPTLAVDPASGKPMYAWHANMDDDEAYYEVVFTSDAFIAGISGLFNDPQIIVDNPITITAPDGYITTDNEFIWPSAVIGPSPIAGKHRVYVLSKNVITHSEGPSENVYLRFADFTADDIEGGIPLLWNTDNFTIPELDQWNVNDIWRRPFYALTCDSMGNLYYCGYHFAYDPATETDIQEADLDIFKCPNYGQGTWSRVSSFSYLPSWNPPAAPNNPAGYFTNENGTPYTDSELHWVIMNSSHMNAAMDSEGRIHIPAIWGLENADGVYYPNLQVVKEFVFDPDAPANHQFTIKEVYPQVRYDNIHDEYFQPWDTEAPWSIVDGWDENASGEYTPQMATIWPFGHWDSSAHTDMMMFHYNNIKITEANDHGMMAMVWLDSQRAHWFNADNDSTYAAYAQSPEIYISVSPYDGLYWSEPIVLNSIDTPQLNGIRPQWVYPADKVVFVGQSGSQKIGKLGIMFYNSYDWYCNSITPPVPVTNPGGQVMFMELQITFPGCPDSPPEQVATPVPSHPSGFYPAPIDVSLTCATPLAQIFYTTDGSSPDYNSVPYTNPIHIAQSCTLKARAFNDYFLPSSVVSRIYQIAVANPDDPQTPIITGISQLYPNPFSSKLNIQVGIKEANQDYLLKIYNLKGQCVYSTKGNATGWLDLSWDGKTNSGAKLPVGIYLLSFKSGTTKQIRKLTLM